jgi:hypothetical protein
MNVDRDQLFEQLRPPRGGAERLSERLVEDQRQRVRAWALQLSAAGIAAALVLLIASQLRFDSFPRDTVQPAGETTPNGETAQVSTDSVEEPETGPPPGDSLFNAPQFDRLLGRTSEQVELSVSIDGEQATVALIASSDPRIRMYMLRTDPINGED